MRKLILGFGRSAIWVLAAAPAALLPAAGSAQTADPTIDAFEQAQQAAWNSHDASAYTASFDTDAQVVSSFGWHWTGQAEAASNLARGFSLIYAHARLQVSDIHARVLAPDLASVTLSWSLEGARQLDTGLSAREQHGFETQLLQRRGTGWFVLAQQDTAETAPASAPAPAPAVISEQTSAPVTTFPTTPPPVRRCILARGNGECMIYGKPKPAPAQ